MTTSRDLHNVLNVIKQNMAKEFGVEYYPISWENYCFFSSPKSKGDKTKRIKVE